MHNCATKSDRAMKIPHMDGQPFGSRVEGNIQSNLLNASCFSDSLNKRELY